LLGVKDHSQSGTVLHGTSRIKTFEFGINIGEGRRGETRKVEQRSIAYEFNNAFSYAESHQN
jgi:hypothetical protein